MKRRAGGGLPDAESGAGGAWPTSGHGTHSRFLDFIVQSNNKEPKTGLRAKPEFVRA
jgi:hypothetical protein